MAAASRSKESVDKLLIDATREELEARLEELADAEREARRPEWEKLEEQMRAQPDFVERPIRARHGPLAKFGYVVGYVLESESLGKRIYKRRRFVPMDGTGKRGFQVRGFRATVTDIGDSTSFIDEEIVDESGEVGSRGALDR